MVNGKQIAAVWHVDDAKASHVNPDVVTELRSRMEELDKEITQNARAPWIKE